MIEIGLWRLQIGLFLCRSMRISVKTCKSTVKKSPSAILKNALRKTRCVLVIVIIMSIIASRALQQCGDVELNPGPLNEDDSRQLTRQTQRKLTFENRGDSDVLRAIGELGKDLREDIRSINDKLAALEKKIDNYETTVENLKQHNKALEDRVLQLENKIKTSQDQKRQYNVILHGIEDGDTKPQETYQRAYSLMEELQLPNINIDQAYRLGKPGQKTQNPRPIMIKLTSVMDKEMVIHKSREIPYKNRPRLTEDFPPELRDTRKKLIPFLIKAKNNGKKASLTRDKLRIESKMYSLEDLENDAHK